MKSNEKPDQNLQVWLDTVKVQEPTAQQSNDMQARLMDSINQYSEATNANSEEKKEPSKLSAMWRWIKDFSTLPKLGFAASLTFVCVLTISIVMSTSVVSPAFAVVKETLAKVSSMYYQGKMFSNEQLTMQIDVYHQAPSKVRVLTQSMMNEQLQMEVISILDTSLGQGLTLMPHAKVAIPMSFAPGENVSDADQNPLLWVNKVLDYEGEVIQLPASWIDGVFANAYQIEAEGMKVTLWINGETQLPVSLIVESPYVDGKRNFVLEATLAFNQVLDPTLFDLHPSDEYKLVNGDN